MDFTITEEAQEQIRAAVDKQRDQDPPKTTMRVEASANGSPDFAYGLRLISAEEENEDDLILELEGIRVAIDPGSAKNLEGAELDYEDRIVRSGFKFSNPNKPETPSIGSGSRDDLSGPVAEKVQRLIDTELNPAVAAHGGHMTLVGVKDDKVYLSFGGGCHGCGMVDVTLKQGVETRIRELIPEIVQVVDTTDHSSGENPFYA
ncbi:MAG TPA: iron-sulfur cluster assembly accessory protein [Acidobacteriota bacterium]|nr:iron-sulfur cluster assembly accessory protein [Acidobacteriota bacterium]